MTEQNLSEVGRRILIQAIAKETDTEERNKVSDKPAEQRTYAEAVEVTEREPETIQEILAGASSATATIANDLYDTFAGLSAQSPDMTASAWSYLTESGKRKATRDHREQIAGEARSRAVTRYNEATATLQERLAAREAFVKNELFGANQDPAVLATLAVASDAAVLQAAKVAHKTGNSALRAAVLAVASERDLDTAIPDVITDHERAFLSELAAMPGPEVMSRQDDAEQVLPIPREDQIMPAKDGTS
jgi:hypothetical protein